MEDVLGGFSVASTRRSSGKHFVAWLIIFTHIATFLPFSGAYANDDIVDLEPIIDFKALFGSNSDLLGSAKTYDFDASTGTVKSITVDGDFSSQLSLFIKRNNIWSEFERLQNVPLAAGTQNISLSDIDAEAIRVQLIPLSDWTGREPVVWLDGIDGEQVFAKSVVGLRLDNLAADRFAPIVMTAQPTAVALGQQGFALALPWTSSQIESAHLRYNVHGVDSAAGVIRQVNDELAQGGAVLTASSSSVWIEEPISPRWLTVGSNRITFRAPDSDYATNFSVTDVQLSVTLKYPSRQARGVRANFGETENALMAVIDGAIDTGVALSLGSTNAHIPGGWSSHWGEESGFGVAPEVEVLFKRSVLLSSVDLVLTGGAVRVALDIRGEQGWIHDVAFVNVAADELTAVSLNLVSPQIATAARLRFKQLSEERVVLIEAQPVGVSVGTDFARLELTPLSRGNLYGDSIYLRGHISSGNSDDLPAIVTAGSTVLLSTLGGGFETWLAQNNGNNSLPIEAELADGSTVSSTLEILGHPDNVTALTFGTPATLGIPVNSVTTEIPTVISTVEQSLTDANSMVSGRSVRARAGEETELSLRGAHLKIGKKALRSKQEVSISALSDRDMPSLSPGMINVTKGGVDGRGKGYRFLPHGVKFDQSVSVRLAFDRSKIPNGSSVDEVKTYFFDEETGRWLALEREDLDEQLDEVVSKTDHFTDMINAVVQVPDAPETTAFNPTRVKDLKIANPAANIDVIQPPSANSEGDARISYPIALPPGRRGMEPQLALQYGSEGGNGWAGLGWSLAAPSISIDTRWGAPRYSNTKETETYSFNGAQLAPTAHRDTPINRVSGDRIFHRRSEAQFARVVRKGSGPTNYWWHVTDKDGLQHFYGGAPTTGVVNDAVLRTQEGNIGHWALLASQDTDGNRIEYRYIKPQDTGFVSHNEDGSGEPGENIYLSEVEYTKHANAQSKTFTVEFIRDRDLGESRRPDVQIDARLGLKRVTADLLRELRVKYDSRLVRRYELIYRKGSFDKTLLESVVHYDSSGGEFYRHNFDYFNDVIDVAGGELFEGERAWSLADNPTNVEVGIPGAAESITNIEDGLTTLGGGSASGSGQSVAVTVGPFDGNLACKSLTAGGHVGGGSSTSIGEISLADMDGDGLPDILVGNNGLKYLPNN